MFANVPGLPAAPPASGLVAAAARPDTTSPEWARWEQGLAWVSERCGAGWQLVPWCTDPDAEGYEPPRPGSGHYRPVGLRVADQCSTLNGRPDDERSLRIAEATTSFAVARELWTGVGTQDDPYSVPGAVGDQTNAWLASPDAEIVPGSAMAPLIAFGRLEQAAMEESRGQQVYLHTPVMLLPQLSEAFRNVGGQLVTHSGNVLVSDAGYPGTGPAGQAVGATAWMYATTPVPVLLSPWDAVQGDTQRVDSRTNTRTTWLSRVFAAPFDPCVHLAAEAIVNPAELIN